jgi:2-oxoglutarate dehydrogenase E2 component (dihydrolipoamide succinyltransferase)
MAKVEVLLPKMGESVAEATITTWLKNVGDTVEAEESIVEIATDKVDSEVPAPEEGTIVELLVQEGDVATVGQAIAVISTNGEAVASAEKEVAAVEPKTPEATQVVAAPAVAASSSRAPALQSNNGNRFYSPLVRSIAGKEGIEQAELDQIPGTGKDGRVTKKDMLAYLESRTGAPSSVSAPATSSAAPTQKITPPSVPITGDDEIIEMDRMRKLIAEHMVMSKQTSPHVTSFVEVDVTKIVEWRNQVKDDFQKREGQKITFTPIFIDAIVRAIKDFPMINVSVDGDKIIRHRNINIGMAAALPSGNLIVPVIKNADMLNLAGLTKSVNDLAARARNNQLKPDEISGGTYTITNVGSFANLLGTPIINQPQVAIMAVGAIVKKPAVIETEHGDLIGIRHKMFLSHSYDHRVVDGALGGMFVRRVADYLEGFNNQQSI